MPYRREATGALSTENPARRPDSRRTRFVVSQNCRGRFYFGTFLRTWAMGYPLAVRSGLGEEFKYLSVVNVFSLDRVEIDLDHASTIPFNSRRLRLSNSVSHLEFNVDVRHAFYSADDVRTD
jgi:hypothetical protein